jgi:hypothetical protein
MSFTSSFMVSRKLDWRCAARNCNQLPPVDGERQRKAVADIVRVISRVEGIRRSIDLLKRTMIDEASDYLLPIARRLLSGVR